MSNSETQSDELLALQSIYEEKYFVVEGTDPPCGRFSAHVQLSEPFYIKLKIFDSSSKNVLPNSSEAEYEQFEISYLPPINLHFEYPESYPSDSPPAFLLSCSWLSYDQLSKLCKNLDLLWSENNGEVILFQWIQFLKDETLNFLQIEECLDISELSKYNLRVDIKNLLSVDADSFNEKCSLSENKNSRNAEGASVSDYHKNPQTSLLFPKPAVSGGEGFRDCRAFLDIADGRVLKNILKNYNEFKKTDEFLNSWHLCDICYADKLGCDFATFKACQHFFCKECLKSYFELNINEGNVSSLNCPYDKCTTQADGTLVKQIVSKVCFERYDLLLLSRTLETMTDIAYCPRKACQCPLLIDVSGRMGTCPACNFVFCPFCKMTYHGVAPCKFDPKFKKQICDDYLNGDEFKKAEIEERHGKRAVKCLVEEVLSEEWLGSNSKPCPHCNASIEKTEGCNKMTCFKCGTFFCWLCGKQLSSTNPYRHYSERGSDCYERLFPPGAIDDGFMFEPGEFLNF